MNLHLHIYDIIYPLSFYFDFEFPRIYLVDGKAILLYVLVVQYISISVRGLYICWQKRVKNLFLKEK